MYYHQNFWCSIQELSALLYSTQSRRSTAIELYDLCWKKHQTYLLSLVVFNAWSSSIQFSSRFDLTRKIANVFHKTRVWICLFNATFENCRVTQPLVLPRSLIFEFPALSSGTLIWHRQLYTNFKANITATTIIFQLIWNDFAEKWSQCQTFILNFENFLWKVKALVFSGKTLGDSSAWH